MTVERNNNNPDLVLVDPSKEVVLYTWTESRPVLRIYLDTWHPKKSKNGATSMCTDSAVYHCINKVQGTHSPRFPIRKHYLPPPLSDFLHPFAASLTGTYFHHGSRKCLGITPEELRQGLPILPSVCLSHRYHPQVRS